MNILKNRHFKFQLVTTLFLAFIVIMQIFFIHTTPLSKLYAQELVSGTVQGVVSDRSNGRVISNATIDLLQNNITVFTTTTVDDGSFLIDIPSGVYGLSVSKRGFNQSDTTITLAGTETITENVSLSPIVADNNVDQTTKSSGAQTGSSKTTTSVFGFINGTIIEAATGLSISKAVVSLKKDDKLIVSNVTPDDGAYFLETQPGEYTLTAEKDGFNTKLVDVSISVFNRSELDVALDVEGTVNGTPTPVSSPTTVPGGSPTPTPTVTEVPVDTPTPTPDLFIELCEGGGNPGYMRVEPSVLMMQGNSQASIKITVLNDEFTDDLKSGTDSDNRQRRRKIKRKRARACITDVKVECDRACKRLKLFKNIVTTNKQGAAHMTIRTRDVKINRFAKLKFTAGDLVETVTVIIMASDPDPTLQ